jgi:hypothetical protein
MALKDAGYTAADWDDWSRRDPKDIIRVNALKNGALFAALRSRSPPGQSYRLRVIMAGSLSASLTMLG